MKILLIIKVINLIKADVTLKNIIATNYYQYYLYYGALLIINNFLLVFTFVTHVISL